MKALHDFVTWHFYFYGKGKFFFFLFTVYFKEYTNALKTKTDKDMLLMSTELSP